MRAISVSVLVLASVLACEGSSEKAARKVEQAGEALREATADGSLLVQSPAPPDAGD